MADKLKFKKSKLSEVYDLAPRLREDDRREVIAAGSTPLQSLKEGVKHSTECISVYTSNDLLIGMYGHTLYKHNIAIVWFLGSDEIENYPFIFIREGKKYLDKLKSQGLIITNCVYSENETHVKYLKCLRVSIDKDNPVIINNETFYRFYK